MLKPPLQYSMWGGAGPRFGESGPRNKWFHKAAPDPTLTRQIEQTRQFASTLRKSGEQRLWSSKYPARKPNRMYSSAPDLAAFPGPIHSTPTIPDNREDRIRLARDKHRLSYRTSKPPDSLIKFQKRSRSLTSNYSSYSSTSDVTRGRNSDFGGNLENGGHFVTRCQPENGDLYDLNQVINETSRMFEPENVPRRNRSLLSLASYSSGSMEPTYARQAADSLVVARPMKLQNRDQMIKQKPRCSRSRSFSRTNTRTRSQSRSSINVRLGIHTVD
ncbi:uncharacterized protein LOC111702249 [Eurytemora carolleeae]|uniref:uncharacterized protein LOC111702249 n=1 Tax=Eurytemora carolleeae TaxID=1294199 RepID=UPI000C7817B0|nr:uncharacterized protein LOC111702249 [Eurytemora carolleeae]|eukprot:XP_023329685.1 uncharacterized protein LOC111702249 [Eurytemora affinis]